MDRLLVKLTAALSLLLFTAACSSAMKRSVDLVLQPDHVTSRSDGGTHRPAWLKETELFLFENGSVKSLGMAEIPGDYDIEAGYRMAENNSKVATASTIEWMVDYIFQQAQNDTAADSTLSRRISAEATQSLTTFMQLEKCYWERVVTTTAHGERVILYRVFTRVSIPEAEFKKAIQIAVQNRSRRGRLTVDFETDLSTPLQTVALSQPL